MEKLVKWKNWLNEQKNWLNGKNWLNKKIGSMEKF